MRKCFVLIISLWGTLAVAAVNINLTFDKSDIQQGSIETATARLKGESLQKIDLQELKNQTLGGVLYLYNVSPLLRKEGSDEYQSEFKIIFIKVPDKTQVTHKIANDEILINWSPVKINPTEVPEKFIFETFEIPGTIQFLKWLLGLIMVLVGFFAFIRFKKSKNLKDQRRLLKQKTKASVLEAHEYHEVVAIWEKKAQILAIFPALAEDFKQLELTLFKFQFKPYQSEAEKAQVMSAYSDFKNKAQGGFDGI